MVPCDSCGQEVEVDGQFCPWCFALVAPAAVVTMPVHAALPALASTPAATPAPASWSAAPEPPAANPWSARPQPAPGQSHPQAPPAPAPAVNQWHAPAPAGFQPGTPTSAPPWAPPSTPPSTPMGSFPPLPPPTGASKLAAWSGWKRIASIVGAVIVAISLLARAGVVDEVIHLGWTKEEKAAQAVLLQPGDLDPSWTAEAVGEEEENTTIGLSDTEADCLDVSPARPVAEASGMAFVRDDVWVSSNSGVWRSEGAARKGAELMSRPTWGECATQALDEQFRKDADVGENLTTAYIGADSLPGTVPITRLRIRLAASNGDGTMGVSTLELFQAFKGRTQVVLYAVTPNGMPDGIAVDMMERMLSRAS